MVSLSCLEKGETPAENIGTAEPKASISNLSISGIVLLKHQLSGYSQRTLPYPAFCQTPTLLLSSPPAQSGKLRHGTIGSFCGATSHSWAEGQARILGSGQGYWDLCWKRRNGLQMGHSLGLGVALTHCSCINCPSSPSSSLIGTSGRDLLWTPIRGFYSKTAPRQAPSNVTAEMSPRWHLHLGTPQRLQMPRETQAGAGLGRLGPSHISRTPIPVSLSADRHNPPAKSCKQNSEPFNQTPSSLLLRSSAGNDPRGN